MQPEDVTVLEAIRHERDRRYVFIHGHIYDVKVAPQLVRHEFERQSVLLQGNHHDISRIPQLFCRVLQRETVAPHRHRRNADIPFHVRARVLERERATFNGLNDCRAVELQPAGRELQRVTVLIHSGPHDGRFVLEFDRRVNEREAILHHGSADDLYVVLEGRPDRPQCRATELDHLDQEPSVVMQLPAGVGEQAHLHVGLEVIAREVDHVRRAQC
mmetsp:Transcript_112982/g.319574  ORF Transcript_112982/g.319574 Transcript_112982/m.319574 type:complete len:216 (+) Transcript_112982:872-1519(+)